MPDFFCWHKVSFSSIHSEHIRDHLASYSNRRSLGITLKLFSFADHGQTGILPGRKLRSFHEHALDVLVALFRKRHAQGLIG